MSEFAGALRERIQFERPGPTGTAAAHWQPDGAAWAAVAPLGPGDRIAGGTLSARPRWRVTVRRRGGIDLDCRIIWRTRTLRLVAITEDPRQPDRLVIDTEEQP